MDDFIAMTLIVFIAFMGGLWNGIEYAKDTNECRPAVHGEQ